MDDISNVLFRAGFIDFGRFRYQHEKKLYIFLGCSLYVGRIVGALTHTKLGEAMSTTVNDFDTAKSISDLLKDMEKDRQQRILRWVAESFDITIHVRHPGQHEPTPSASSAGSVGIQGHTPTGQATNIKSFVESKSPKNDIQFAAVVAYYYRFEAPVDDRRETITADVLQDAARLAGHARFAKPLVTLNNAKKLGYLDTAERGTFGINSVGENLVAMTLPGSDNGAKAKPKRQAKSKKVATRGRAR